MKHNGQPLNRLPIVFLQSSSCPETDMLYLPGWYSRFTMGRSKNQSILLAAALLAALCAPAHSQSIKETSVAPTAPKEKTIPTPAPLKPQFSDNLDPHRPHSVEFRTLDQMTEKDRLQAVNAESSIAEQARYSNLEFNQGQWAYQQVLCPALSNHIFLRFLRNNGTGDVTVFTASIPRGEEGRVRIVPIQRRGYSLFSPAPINALTISAFNHIRAEENPDQNPVQAPDWLGTALCYAALAGGHPQAATLSDHPEAEKFPPAGTALLAVGNSGGAELSFVDVSTAPHPMRWSMTFDRKGKLIKGGHAPAELLKISSKNPPLVDQLGAPKPLTTPKVTTSNPPAPAAVVQHPAPPPQPTVASTAAPK